MNKLMNAKDDMVFGRVSDSGTFVNGLRDKVSFRIRVSSLLPLS